MNFYSKSLMVAAALLVGSSALAKSKLKLSDDVKDLRSQIFAKNNKNEVIQNLIGVEATTGDVCLITVSNSPSSKSLAISVRTPKTNYEDDFYLTIDTENQSTLNVKNSDIVAGKLEFSASVPDTSAGETYSVNSISMNYAGRSDLLPTLSTLVASEKIVAKKSTARSHALNCTSIKPQLELTAKTLRELGKQMMDDMKPGRTDTTIYSPACEIQSSHEMKCDVYIPTDYADDIVHGTFEIGGGKVIKLVKTEFEPGC
jgi:hypothetical protein